MCTRTRSAVSTQAGCRPPLRAVRSGSRVRRSLTTRPKAIPRWSASTITPRCCWSTPPTGWSRTTTKTTASCSTPRPAPPSRKTPTRPSTSAKASSASTGPGRSSRSSRRSDHETMAARRRAHSRDAAVLGSARPCRPAQAHHHHRRGPQRRGDPDRRHPYRSGTWLERPQWRWRHAVPVHAGQHRRANRQPVQGQASRRWAVQRHLRQPHRPALPTDRARRPASHPRPHHRPPPARAVRPRPAARPRRHDQSQSRPRAHRLADLVLVRRLPRPAPDQDRQRPRRDRPSRGHPYRVPVGLRRRGHDDEQGSRPPVPAALHNLPHLSGRPRPSDGAVHLRLRRALAGARRAVDADGADLAHRHRNLGGRPEPERPRPIAERSEPVLRRLASALGLTVTLVGMPVVLRAAAGPPSLAGLPTWQWLRDGLRDQYLPVDPILHAIGLLAWSLWGYAVIVALLRVVAVLAARRRLAGAAALLALSNLVTLASVRGLLDASIGVSLLAASTRATPTNTTAAAAPVAVVRTIQPQAAQDRAGWDRARPLLHDTRPRTASREPALAHPDPPALG